MWHYLITLRRYARALSKSKRIGYVGAQGNMNLGDEVLCDVMRILLSDFGIYPYRATRRDLIIESLVPHRKLVNCLCLGGGTIIGKPLYLPPVRELLKRNLPAFSLGTGVINPEFWRHCAPWFQDQQREWIRSLKSFEEVTVRGPISQQILAGQGIESTVVGDPALLLLEDGIPSPPNRRILGVNIGTSLGLIYGEDEEKVVLGVVKACTELQKHGWEIQVYSIWPMDDAYSTFLAQSLAQPAKIFRYYTNVRLFKRQVSRCSVFLGMKLHATILALCSHVPSIMLEYRPKCRDFMVSVGLERYCIRTDELGGQNLASLVEVASEQRSEIQQVFRAAAHVYKNKLHCLAERIRQAVS